MAHRIATETADSMPFDIAPGVLDPREVIRAIDAVVPKDWDIVVGGGHQAYFNTQMRGRPAERYTTVRGKPKWPRSLSPKDIANCSESWQLRRMAAT
jgi:hypothetical protein